MPANVASSMLLRTGTWTPTGSMKNARGQHAMVSLPGGNALVTGGYNLRSELASTEVYTASTGQWSLVGPMSTTRTYFNLVALSDGKVLATGGQNASAVLATSELYDPATSKWSATGSLPAAVEYPASALLGDGTVLLAGKTALKYCRQHVRPPHSDAISTLMIFPQGNCMCIAGGVTNDGTVATAEIYSEATGTAPQPGHCLCRRCAFLWLSFVPTDSFNLLVMCLTALDSPFGCSAGAWLPTGSLSTARFNFPAVALGASTALVAGGGNATGAALASAELFNTATGVWSTTAAMSVPRIDFQLVAL